MPTILSFEDSVFLAEVAVKLDYISMTAETPDMSHFLVVLVKLTQSTHVLFCSILIILHSYMRDSTLNMKMP